MRACLFSLQSKLTVSHLIVTIVTVLVLDTVILLGYFVYLRTDFAARWAGEWAALIAEDIAFILEEDPLTQEFAEEIVFDYGFDPLFDEPVNFLYDANYDDGLVIFDPSGNVLASSDLIAFPVGSSPSGDNLAGINSDMFNPDQRAQQLDFSIEGPDHIGQAAVRSDKGRLLGVVYYRAAYAAEIGPFSSGQALLAFGLVLSGGALIAIVISGLVGGLLAFSFSRRLRRLRQASAAVAVGDLSQRVPSRGGDEIDALGAQFNTMAAQLAEQMAQLRDLATLEERNRLARELHDAVKQEIFALSLSAATIRQLQTRDPAQASARLIELEEQARTVHQEMDDLIHQLRPATLDNRGLATAMRELTGVWERQYGLAVNYSIHGERELPLQVEHTLYRIAQEALNNVARHAEAGQAEVVLDYRLEQVELQITDDGLGFEPATSGSPCSHGLQSMQERMQEIGGLLTIDSRKGRGTTVTATVPASTLDMNHD